MKDEFIIKYDFTLAEYLSMNYQAMFRIKLTRGLLTFVTLVGIFGAVIQALLPGTGKGSLLSTYGRFLFLPVFLLLFLFIFIGLASLVLFRLKLIFLKVSNTFSITGGCKKPLRVKTFRLNGAGLSGTVNHPDLYFYTSMKKMLSPYKKECSAVKLSWNPSGNLSKKN